MLLFLLPSSSTSSRPQRYSEKKASGSDADDCESSSIESNKSDESEPPSRKHTRMGGARGKAMPHVAGFSATSGDAERAADVKEAPWLPGPGVFIPRACQTTRPRRRSSQVHHRSTSRGRALPSSRRVISIFTWYSSFSATRSQLASAGVLRRRLGFPGLWCVF